MLDGKSLYVMRNHTAEPFFTGAKASYSHYDGIAPFDEQAELLVWFYLLPVKTDTQALAEEVRSYRTLLSEAIEKAEGRPLLAFTLEPVFVYDWQYGDRSLHREIQAFNNFLGDSAQQHNNLKIIDFGSFLSRYQSDDVVDWKYYFYSRMLLNPTLRQDFDHWLHGRYRAALAQRKKCLVLDLDNTLWGGVLGEDGERGIALGDSYPGSAYKEFQQAIRHAGTQGVILAVCSKNNAEDVTNLMQSHPEMLLRKDSFAALKVNWQDKATNLREIASELNIGLDSIVFIDDSPQERAYIRMTLPEVTVPEFPTQPYQLPAFFRSVYEQHFAIYHLTAEDKDKQEQYQSNAQRQEYASSFNGRTEYLYSLNTVMEITSLNKYNLSRISQLTQKTNQFNLTTRRYSEEDILNKANAGSLVFCARIRDRFGDIGITAVAIIDITEPEKAVFDTFLLSCRILGREIEDAFLQSLLIKLRQIGIKEVAASYLPTAKNIQTADFWDRAGFALIKEEDGAKHYLLSTDTYHPTPIIHIEVSYDE